MKQSILSIFLKSFVILVATLCAACQEDVVDSTHKRPGDLVEFSASVCETDEVRTRALETKYISSEPFNMDFYIQLCCDKDETAEGKVETVGTYVVPSGYEGQLVSKDSGTPLTWVDITSLHTFYAWNIPWNEEDADKYKDNERYHPDNEDDAEKIEEGIKIKFYNSSEEDGYQHYRNNAIYENFIGAKSKEPYSYKEHGKYVDLTFHHLVSKIRIGSFILIEPGGAIQKNLKANLTFVGMPTEATFYPHPKGDGRPRVEYDKTEDWKNNGVDFYIEHNPSGEGNTDDVFYICPEVDFRTIDFKVKINNAEYATYDTYYGTFDDVKFERRPGIDYDDEEKGDEKILHAGEMMTINITLIPGMGPGLSLIIDKWNTDDPKKSQYHTHSGIYSDAEVKELIDLFYNQKDYTEEAIEEILERLFEMYGNGETEDGKMIFQLFENVNYDSNIFPVWKDCIIDGMGHTITLKTNNNNTQYVQGPYFNVGPVRDVYLTDKDGKNTIYIDSDGYVCLFNSDKNEYVRTENQLTELTYPEKSYDISCVDGKVHKSTYYNNSITGS